jgi:hypothetical protein
MLHDVSVALVVPADDLPPGYKSTLLRRLRVFTLTAAKPALDRVGHKACHAAAEVGWRLAEGMASADELAANAEGLRAAWAEGIEAAMHYYEAPDEVWALPRLVNVLTLLFREPDGAARHLIVPLSLVHPGRPVPLLTPEETRNCCWLLREVFGNRGGLLTSPLWEETWLTDTAVTLAAHMYESREFGAMPILADALQDAGCDNQDVLGHCRGPGPHIRSCWVVDLVLGKGGSGPSNQV